MPEDVVRWKVNHAHNEYHRDKVGFFGLYECLDDEEAYDYRRRADIIGPGRRRSPARSDTNVS